MKEIIEAIAAAHGWIFEYGRKDFLNLFNDLEQKNVSHLLVEPAEITDNDNDLGVTESRTYSGYITMVLSSDINEESYESRYDQYIKPIIDADLKTLKYEMRCGQEIVFNQWKTTELINVFDFNLDGVLITYNVTIDK